MPFTATHIAAVVPFAWLCRWRLPLSALAIGSMVPDLAGFYPRLFDYPTLHSFPGVFTHCIPLGLIGFYLFHWVFKQPLVDLLPPIFRRRLFGWSRQEFDLGITRMLTVIGCVAFGAVTHVIWDAFTHEAGWGVAMFPALSQVVTDYQGYSIRLCAVLQHASSLFLLPPMAIAFLWWVMHQTVSPMVDQRKQWKMPQAVTWTTVLMFAVGTFLYFQSLQNQLQATWVGSLRIMVKHCGAIMILVLLLYCVGMQLAWLVQRRLVRQQEDETDVALEANTGGSLLVADSPQDVLRNCLSRSRRGEFTIVDSDRLPTGPGSSRRSDGSLSSGSLEHRDVR